MKQLIYLFIIGLWVVAACSTRIKSGETSPDPITPKQGAWQVNLQLGPQGSLPFDLEFTSSNTAIIRNAEEEITVRDIQYKNDSIFIKVPVFDSELKGRLISETVISGAWYNYYKGKDYVVPFNAQYGDKPRWSCRANNVSASLSGQKWEVTFSPNTENEYKALGVFSEQKDGSISGTFITETGDYRFLEGNYCDNGFNLSCFDGSHAFLFKAKFSEDGSLIGEFYSGVHWSEPWMARKNPGFSISDPYSLTYIKEGYDDLSFSFPDVDSNIVSFPSEAFKDKVTVVQVLGSWCPNCMDETKVLTEFYNKYKGEGLRIIGLCFEKPEDFGSAVRNIKRLKSYFDSKYTFLYAGKANKSEANNVLPMLNHIMSFPTSIFIDKKGNIRKIHTGFYGPGTGEYYEKTVDEFESTLIALLNE